MAPDARAVCVDVAGRTCSLTVVVSGHPRVFATIAVLLAHRRIELRGLEVTGELDGQRVLDLRIVADSPADVDRAVRYLNRCIDVIRVLAPVVDDAERAGAGQGTG